MEEHKIMSDRMHYEQILQDRLQEIDRDDKLRIRAILGLDAQIRGIQESDSLMEGDVR